MFNRFKHEIIGIVLLALGVFIFLALVGYHPDDPGFGRVGAIQVKNFTGLIGAYISAFFFDLAGIGAWFVPIFLILGGIWLFSGQKQGLRLLVAAVLFISSVSFLEPLANLHGEIGPYPLNGGLLGVLGKQLVALLGKPGLFLIIVLFQLVALSLISGFSPKELLERAKNFVVFLISKFKTFFSRETHESPVQEARELVSAFEPQIPEAQEIYPEPEEDLYTPEKDESKKLPTPSIGQKFQKPPLNLLNDPPPQVKRESKEELLARAKLLEQKLEDFGVRGKVTEICPGPVITVYEYEPAPGIKINKISSLADDLALGLKAASVRIVAPIPGKSAVGIEVANREREIVYLKEILASETYRKAKSKLTLALGKDISGRPVVTDLAKMPHLLIAGATGTGKSVCLHSMLMSLLFKATPEEVRLLLIDPKRIELSVYDGIPHLLHPVLLEPKTATLALKWAVAEMERRYQLLEEARARNLESYNAQAEEKLPYIVIVVDELADLMVVSSKDVEMSLTRLAQMARASGIHLLLATQRPSVDVLTGIIKANFPARISFQVSSRTDSRTILDTGGAERLLGAGDMLFLPPGTSKLKRIHGAYISEEEVKRVIEFLQSQGEPAYEIEFTVTEEGGSEIADDEVDELYEQAVQIVVQTGQASISMLQRRLRVGYNRAARMIERMEKEGIVGPSDGVRPRPVLRSPDK
ncbi:cell division protein FtsK/SpoIIIE [Thermodesulfatator indicus DSM 15286]|uniref:Cell division protein FtsK/SpoIIIE n=1 Tax=Thermodesulfatator indicus (strain DSM 15286 / JCM 11887 / CIR29812) TaxID=667014 RepID=F8ACH0_THEID|nr:DNA translocase FtsK [Thermodesulfatator indicus]AEH44671.1 cell division protein FtsK/SpoIIIE [Thermodesulfatator indicus DSM 15286]